MNTNSSYNYYNDSINRKFGKIIHINELEKEPKKYIGETVRVLGKLININLRENLVLLEHPLSHSKLLVDTKHLGNWSGRLKSFQQFIGEIKEYHNTDISNKFHNTIIKTYNNGIILKANIVRCVDGLDFHVYEKVVDIRRQFEQQYYVNS
ncbi:hypothetical protein BCR36DRAFT_416602 [Piromyces finnis]|uniref:CST complex subunit Stn1 N-terminal domain-containing protein n=1 Tax=Piromyces finnis TaxID=1754191 RepID=A0A1Y1UVR4_9FUNG|nr:hypothetical protein BCR36DRAFT_416602 [Piromyces finnis]|eukprot:ORX41707.1 hypothetical protein BCR36DRAFT_416602 [Piromyces finnis]